MTCSDSKVQISTHFPSQTCILWTLQNLFIAKAMVRIGLCAEAGLSIGSSNLFKRHNFNILDKCFILHLKLSNTELLHSLPTLPTVSITRASCIHPSPIRHSVFLSIFIVIKGADCNSLHQLLKPQW